MTKEVAKIRASFQVFYADVDESEWSDEYDCDLAEADGCDYTDV